MIDEKKLINYIKAQINPYGKPFEGTAYEFGLKVMNHIENMKKVGEWIPCSEALPPKPEENPIFDNKPLELYLVSVKNADYPIRAFWNGKFFTDGWSKVDVIAWQPLPQPFQKGE